MLLVIFNFEGRENRDLDILIFKEVLDTMSRVDRVLTMPGGSLLMAGRSGVGRRTAVVVVAHMHHIDLITPKIARGYGMKQFKNDLKTVCCCCCFEFFNYQHTVLVKLYQMSEEHPRDQNA